MRKLLVERIAFILVNFGAITVGNAFLPASSSRTFYRQKCQQHLVTPPVAHGTKRPLSSTPWLSASRRSSEGNEVRTTRPGGRRLSLWRRLRSRLNTIQSAGFRKEDQVLTAGIGSLFGKVKKIHNPITYFALLIAAGFRWDWCFRNPIYWFAVGFCIKWYRARYVFKIPVWDRQPNWNNIITSKDQEKDLKAFTCKNCGSTIFIAKTREFFFEGDTGIGGLGCFSCGAKGRDNFIMDRDRIVEDVGDMDDYFEYERPLDFVSRAERRKLLKETKGDEEKANQILLDRAAASAPPTPEVQDAVIVEEPTETSDESNKETETPMAEESAATPAEKGVTESTEPEKDETVSEPETVSESAEPEIEAESVSKQEPSHEAKTKEAPTEPKGVIEEVPESEVAREATPVKPAPKKKPSSPQPQVSSAKGGGIDLDDLDELDMDAF